MLPRPPLSSPPHSGPSTAGRALAIIVGLLVLALAIGLYPTFRALNGAIVGVIERAGPLIGWVALFFGLTILIGLAGLLFARVRTAYHTAQQAAMIKLPGGLLAHVGDVKWRKARPTLANEWRWSMDKHFGVDLATAQRATPELHNQSIHIQQLPPPPPPQIADVTPPQLPDPLSGLGDAIARGWSSPDRWLIGMASGTPQQIVLKHTGFIAISGVQGTGKTNGAAWLAAQCAAHNGTLYIADPHYGDEESLSSRIKPFSGAVARWAMTPDEIIAMIAKVDSIYAYRRDHPGSYPPLLLIIDEFMELMIRKQLSPTAIESLLALSGVGRKKHIFCAPIAQNWNLRVLGALGVSVRQAVTHALVFKSSKETAELLLPSSYAQRALMLKPGQTLYFANDEPQVTDVPWLSSEDMQLAARGRTPTSYTPAARAITGGFSAAPAQQLTPTERVPPPVLRPAPPTTPFTIAEQITDLLRFTPDWLTSSEIVDRLQSDPATTMNELTKLSRAKSIQQRRSQRPGREKYEYSADPISMSA